MIGGAAPATTVALVRRATLIGIDLIDDRRFAEREPAWLERFDARHLGPTEAATIAALEPAAAARHRKVCIGAKEALIKAVGFRPDRFDWREVEYLPDADHHPVVLRQVSDVGRALGAIEAFGGGICLTSSRVHELVCSRFLEANGDAVAHAGWLDSGRAVAVFVLCEPELGAGVGQPR